MQFLDIDYRKQTREAGEARAQGSKPDEINFYSAAISLYESWDEVYLVAFIVTSAKMIPRYRYICMSRDSSSKLLGAGTLFHHQSQRFSTKPTKSIRHHYSARLSNSLSFNSSGQTPLLLSIKTFYQTYHIRPFFP